MQCPNCQSEVRDGAQFCSACGAPVEVPAPEPASEPTPDAMPDAPPPFDPAAYEQQQYALAQQQYAREQAAYEQEKAAYDRQVAAAAQPASGSQVLSGQPAQAPAKKSKTGLIIVAIVVGVLLLCVALGVGGLLALRAVNDRDGDVVVPPGDAETTRPEETTGSGYTSHEDAMLAELEASDAGDWAYQLYREGETEVTYWAGPPQSEYVEEIIVTKNADGTWTVTEVNDLEIGGDVPEGTGGSQAEAMNVVSQFLYAVQDDRGEDAHALTVEPFSNDAASAQVSAGMFETFEVSGAVEQSDGSYWVETVQVWSGAEERWQYLVVPTEAGYYIADLQPW